MNKFDEIYKKIISEANYNIDKNEKLSEDNKKKSSIVKKIEDEFKNHFIGRKYICAWCSPNKKKSINEQIEIKRGTIIDINVELNKVLSNERGYWVVEAIFDNNEDIDRCVLSEDKLKDLTIEKFEKTLKETFSGKVQYYKKSYDDGPGGSGTEFPESVVYKAPDNGQTDEEIIKMIKSIASKNLLIEKQKLLKEREIINKQLQNIDIFLDVE